MRRYQIVVRGEFGDLLSTAFSGLKIETGGGKTVLTARVMHRDGLYEILERLRDFAIDIVSVDEMSTRESHKAHLYSVQSKGALSTKTEPSADVAR